MLYYRRIWLTHSDEIIPKVYSKKFNGTASLAFSFKFRWVSLILSNSWIVCQWITTVSDSKCFWEQPVNFSNSKTPNFTCYGKSKRNGKFKGCTSLYIGKSASFLEALINWHRRGKVHNGASNSGIFYNVRNYKAIHLILTSDFWWYLQAIKFNTVHYFFCRLDQLRDAIWASWGSLENLRQRIAQGTRHVLRVYLWFMIKN